MPVNVGLDLGASAVRGAVVRVDKGKPKLDRFGQVSLPPGTIVGGEVQDELALTESLRQLWKTAKLPKKRVVVGIANQRVIVRRIDLPYLDPDVLRESLAFHAEEHLPIPSAEASLDYIPLEEFVAPSGEAMMSILVVAAPKSSTERLVEIVSSIGAKVVAIDLQAFALARAAYAGGLPATAEDDEEVAVVDIGGNMTQVSVFKGRTVRFLRILSHGGETFTQALQDELGMSHAEASQLKMKTGIANGTGTTPDNLDGAAEARNILTKVAGQLVAEVRNSITYYTTQAPGSDIRRILIAGNGARLPHLASVLGHELAIPIHPVRLIDDDGLEVTRKIAMSETEMLSAQPVLPVAAGLSLWGNS